LSELEIGRVGGEQARRRADGALEAHLRVDVEHAARAAGRPDDGGRVRLVVLEVVAGDGAGELVLSGGLGVVSTFGGLVAGREIPTYLRSLTREVVGGLKGSGDTLLDVGVAAVIGGQDRVLEAAGVEEVDVELAVLALLGDGNTGADGGNVRVEDERHDAAVGRDLGAHGALGAAGSTIADTPDGDLVCISH
jgi:hypothetical protein